jgi:nitrate reductase (cytochrome)
MRNMDRRRFLVSAAAASAATAAALAPGALFGGVGAAPGPSTGPEWRRAPCNLCGTGCGLLIGTQGGRAVAVRGDPEAGANRGLACVKGYLAIQALYGRDRLTQASVKRQGTPVETPLSEALDLVAARLADTVRRHGPGSVAIYGSGQWSVPAAYAAVKLFKGGLGSPNVETSARLSSGSAQAGCLSTFGAEGVVGGFDDIESADVLVLWGTNLAEAHPVLFSRVLERRRLSPGVRIVTLGTRTTRTSYAADRALLCHPGAGLVLANAIAREIVARGAVDREFIDRHVSFRRGSDAPGMPIPGAEAGAPASWSAYVRFLEEYTPERAERVSGLPAAEIRWLASLYADRARRVTTLWDEEVNQHARGTWLNNLLYNLHLLVGKVATPGNSPLPLASQPSAGGSGSEVGAFAEGLPAGDVRREADRARAARIWGVPVERIPSRPGPDPLTLFRRVQQGEIRFLWVQASNPLVTLPRLAEQRRALEGEGCFLVVSDAYPTRTTAAADVVLPAALWVESAGVYGSGERRTQHFPQMLRPPGAATGDAHQVAAVARRLGFGALFPWPDERLVEGLWSEYARFRERPDQRPATLAELRLGPGLRWPYVEGRETLRRYATAADPAADPARGTFDFYGTPDHRARIWLRPHQPAAETPDGEFPFWLSVGPVLEHAGSGTLTRRVPDLHRAMPGGYVEIHREDARGLGIRAGETVRLVSRRGSLRLPARIDHRSQPPRGQVFVPNFDDGLPVNLLTGDTACPQSGQPATRWAVRLERVAP